MKIKPFRYREGEGDRIQLCWKGGHLWFRSECMLIDGHWLCPKHAEMTIKTKRAKQKRAMPTGGG